MCAYSACWCHKDEADTCEDVSAIQDHLDKLDKLQTETEG